MDDDRLTGWRAKIGTIDFEIARLLEKRLELCKEIGRFKLANMQPIDNGEREKEILKRITEESKLEPEFIHDLFGIVFGESKRVQERLKE